MDCARYESDLSAYISGAASTAALDEHLASCARCRALAADLRAIRTTARTLEAHEPPPEVWPRLAAGLGDSSRRGRLPRLWSYMTARPLAAAAVVLIALAAWMGTRTVLDTGTTSEEVGALSPAARIVEATAAEISRLEQIASPEDVAALDPETADVLKENLTVIDQAIGETRAALDAEPNNELVLESLFDALQSKLALFQDMIVLINELSKGNQEEAARIASEVDP